MDIAQELIEQHDKGENCLGMTNIFFDGEEALVDFTETDGLYGSKHLAEKWAKSSMLEQIRLFILLDLVGATAPNFNTYSVTFSSLLLKDSLTFAHSLMTLKNETLTMIT